jgi:translation elongation factor EF-Tu-like GTPase
MVDQLEHVEATSERRGDGYVNLALLTDGLRAEREQGITIDVAYRSFVTPRRRFQLADAPGHVQYTRNMVTGASTADLAVVLVDARKGMLEQSRRHAFLVTLLRVPHLVVAVNKMDLVDYSQEVFERDGMLYAANDLCPPADGEVVFGAVVRYRTMGDANLTAAVRSEADTIEAIIAEIAATRLTERGATRGDDRVSEAAMEDRTRLGYF